MRRSKLVLILFAVAFGTLAIFPTSAGEKQSTTFAVIGDFGSRDAREREVVDLVKGWKPDFIVTVGDNSYGKGSDAFQKDVVDYFGEYILSPAQDPTAKHTRFFPAIGNHDLGEGGQGFQPARLAAYRATFALPAGGNGRYYEFARGPVHIFALDSDPPDTGWDGTQLGSKQETWFREALKRAKSAKLEPWMIAYFHHSPLSLQSTSPKGYLDAGLETGRGRTDGGRDWTRTHL